MTKGTEAAGRVKLYYTRDREPLSHVRNAFRSLVFT
jgi:hypothetical protein